MQLSRMSISFQDYGVNKNRYTGEAYFKNESGGVQIVLTPDVSDKILAIVAEAVVSNAKEVANELTAATLTQVSGPLLTHEA